ncbi:hypothetical protein [Haloplanus sp.]|uniref:hypothetical protein n=1 Tax=Haloplanus sp. TaxID=1961696 RepID=UPI0026375118|nr:hypothetical protein [Haloplanus sp.]
MSDERGPAHCPQCAVVEPAGGFDRNDPVGTSTITRFRCLDCRATFAWRCFPTDPECGHGPFRYEGDRFVFYFGQGTRPEASCLPATRASSDGGRREQAAAECYRADLDIASYEAFRRFLDATSDALVGPEEATTLQSKLEAAGGVDWPCEIGFSFDRQEWAAYSASHPDEATVLEPHLVSVDA